MTSVDLSVSGPSSSKDHSQSLLLHVKESLINSAAAYASRGKVRLHVLFSKPRHALDLYPFAHIDPSDAVKTSKEQPVEAYVEHVILTASWREEEEKQTQQEGSYKQGRLMYALECFLYTLPKHKSALLYVSKLDSSGWGPSITPKHLQDLLKATPKSAQWDSSTSITRVITQAFLSYFASLSHWSNDGLPSVCHVSIHILARAQGAYLFPSSNDNKGKHVLSDGALIKWWRSVMSSVVCGVRRRKEDTTRIDARPYYLIPGYDRLESHELLPLPPTAPASHAEPDVVLPVGNQALAEAGWVYGHPYSCKGANLKDENTPLPPLPLSGPSFKTRGNAAFPFDKIALLLPHFPDDPKSRFIAEIARDSYEHAKLPKRKAEAKVDEEENGNVKKQKVDQEDTPLVNNHIQTEGAKEGSAGTANSLLMKAMRERSALDSVTADEFWTRMGFRQECCAGNAVGVFVALFTRPNVQEKTAIDGVGNEEKEETMSSQKLALPHPILPDLIRKHLMRDVCDWSKAEGSRDLTRAWDEGVERAVKRKGGANLLEEREELGRDVVYADVVLNGPTEKELSDAEVKWKGTVTSDTAPVTAAAAAAPINTLSVKRKKKV